MIRGRFVKVLAQELAEGQVPPRLAGWSPLAGDARQPAEQGELEQDHRVAAGLNQWGCRTVPSSAGRRRSRRPRSPGAADGPRESAQGGRIEELQSKCLLAQHPPERVRGRLIAFNLPPSLTLGKFGNRPRVAQ